MNFRWEYLSPQTNIFIQKLTLFMGSPDTIKTLLALNYQSFKAFGIFSYLNYRNIGHYYLKTFHFISGLKLTIEPRMVQNTPHTTLTLFH